jgi:hypothetical protein
VQEERRKAKQEEQAEE